MPRIQAVRELEISPKQEDREAEKNDTMIQSVDDPQPELCAGEKFISLAEDIQLRVAIQYAGGYKLVEDTDDEWGKHSENDVVQGQRPRLVGDLAGEVVEERVLCEE